MPRIYQKRYFIKRKCNNCKKEFLTNNYAIKKGRGKFCSLHCASSGKYNAMFGKHLTEETKRKMSNFFKGRKQSLEHKIKRGLYLRGKNALNWRGGITKHPTGYVYIKNPNHPFCNKEKYVIRSRLIMEKFLGRYLKPTEVVHHINGIKDDDRMENLQLFSSNSEHMKFHQFNKNKLS